MPAVAGFAPALSRSPSPRLGLPRILPFARSLQARLGESLALPRGLPTISDISISFPPWMIAWFLLGEATPFITLVLISSVAAFFFSRGTGRTRRARWLKWTLAIVGGLWLGGISFWAAGLVDQVKTDIYQAQHHYRLDKATVLAGIEIPRGSWVSVDEEGMLYGIETAQDAAVSIDGASWRGDIRLIPVRNHKASDRGIITQPDRAAMAASQRQLPLALRVPDH